MSANAIFHTKGTNGISSTSIFVLQNSFFLHQPLIRSCTFLSAIIDRLNDAETVVV